MRKLRDIALGIALVVVGMGFGPGVRAQSGWNYVGNPGLSQGETPDADIVVDADDVIHVAYIDEALQNVPRVLRYDGGWQEVGTDSLPTSAFEACEIGLDPTGRPVLALAPEAQVLQWDGMGWQLLGTGSLATDAEGLHMRIAAQGDVYLCFWRPAGTAHVWKYAGSWAEIGVFSDRILDMELGDGGAPIVLFENAISVKAWQGGNWVQQTAFTTPAEQYFDMAVNHNGAHVEIYVARRDAAGGIAVEVLEQGQWSDVGTPNFAFSQAGELGIAPSNKLHFAYKNLSLTPQSPSVQRFDGSNWAYVGDTAIIANEITQPQIAFGTDARYLLFRDLVQDEKPAVMSAIFMVGSENQHTSARGILFPNPAKDAVTLRFPTPTQVAAIHLSDALGRTVRRYRSGTRSTFTLALPTLPPGSYHLHFTTDGHWRHQKLYIHP